MAQTGEGRAAGGRTDWESECENTSRRERKNPGNHHEQRVRNSVEEGHDRAAPIGRNPRERQGKQTSENRQRQDVAITCSGNDVGRNDALEKFGRARKRGGSLLLDLSECSLKQGGRFSSERKEMHQHQSRNSANNRRDGANYDDP